jgi:hypothetical protein
VSRYLIEIFSLEPLLRRLIRWCGFADAKDACECSASCLARLSESVSRIGRSIFQVGEI